MIGYRPDARLPVLKCCDAIEKAFRQGMVCFVSPNDETPLKFIKWLDTYDGKSLTSIHCPFCEKEIKQKEN